MIQLNNKEALEKLFSDAENLGDFLPTLNSCCFIINQSLKKVLNKAFTQKIFLNDLEDDFGTAASSL